MAKGASALLANIINLYGILGRDLASAMERELHMSLRM